MTKLNKLLKILCVVLGLIAIGFFVFDFILFSHLRPQMITFAVIDPAEENMLNLVGVGLLVLLIFYLLSLYRIVDFLKKAEEITFALIVMVVSGVLSLLFVFADLALLNDIGKQYRFGLAQPEWLLLYPVMGFQSISTILFIYLHLFGLNQKDQVKEVALDSNIFLIAQYVGLLCGLMGLVSSSLGFFFPRGWTLKTHSTLSSIILLAPYALVVGYWLFIKVQESNRLLYDEKQVQDIGKSAFWTLIVSVAFMTGLFVANYNNLGGVVSILWLPLYLFSILFLFSLGNIYFSRKES